MREIKFRAWNKRNMQMVSNVDWPWQEDAYSINDGLAKMDWLVLMQFTGLKDKNGKEIYEGDIVRDEWGSKHEVRIEKLIHADNENYWTGVGWALETADTDKCEVVGNIYENPELLKV